jgi:hypothetical protein
VLAFNNLSSLSDSLSDAISSLATEGGFVTRSLFTDDDETRFRERRPIVANGIPDFVTRGDLADRSIKIVLKRIETRRDEADVRAAFERMQPRLLGVLFDAVAAALRDGHKVVLRDPPRMADAARWVTAAESAFGWREGTFVAAYNRVVAGMYAAVIEADPVAEAILAFATPLGWSGTAGDLLKLLKPPAADAQRGSPERTWPKTAHATASALRRLAPALRRAGIDVADAGEDPKRRLRLWRIVRLADDRPGPGSEASQGSEGSNAPGTGAQGSPKREPSPEPSSGEGSSKARDASPGPTEDRSLASLASLPIPTVRDAPPEEAANDTYTCPGCGAEVTDAHECPGNER